MMVIEIVYNVDNFVDNLCITLQSSNDYYYCFYNLARFKSKKIERFTIPDKNKRIANWIYYNGSAIAYQATDQLQTYKNTVLL